MEVVAVQYVVTSSLPISDFLMFVLNHWQFLHSELVVAVQCAVAYLFLTFLCLYSIIGDFFIPNSTPTLVVAVQCVVAYLFLTF